MLDIEVRAKWSASVLLTLPILIMPSLDQIVSSCCCLPVVVYLLFTYCLLVVYLYTSGWSGVARSGRGNVSAWQSQENAVSTNQKVRIRICLFTQLFTQLFTKILSLVKDSFTGIPGVHF